MKLPTYFCVLLTLALTSPPSSTALAASPADLTLLEVAPGILVRPGKHAIVFEDSNIANIGAIIGESCIAIVDTGGSIAEGSALRSAVEKHSSTPICYVLNTHGHPDHFLGNAAFNDIDGIQFYGHAAMEQSSAAARETWLGRLSDQQKKPTPDNIWLMPNHTVSGSETLDLGGRKIVLKALPTAHSHSDLTVYDPTTGSLWLSDLLFVDHVPVLAGSISGWIEVLEEISAQNVERLIPGHGPTSIELPTTAIATQQRYLESIKAKSLTQIDAGVSLYDAQQSAKNSSNNNWLLYGQYHSRNIARAWGELEWLD